MRRSFLVFLSLLLVLVAFYSGTSWYIASQATKAERKPLEDTLARLEVSFEDVVFPARDNSAILRGWYLPTNNARGAIIMVHGLDSNRGSPDFVDLAAGLYRNGFSVLSFDLRGHGESSPGRLSGGLFEQEDVLGAYDWLIGQGLLPGKIGLLGISMGASISLLAGAREPGIAAVVADSPFTDIRDMIGSELPRRGPVPSWLAPMFIPGTTLAARVFYSIDLSRIVPEKAIGNLGYPVFLIHCLGDERIFPEHSRRLQRASPSSVLWLAPGKEHGQAFKTFPREYLRRVSDYLHQRFSASTPLFKGTSSWFYLPSIRHEPI